MYFLHLMLLKSFPRRRQNLFQLKLKVGLAKEDGQVQDSYKHQEYFYLICGGESGPLDQL